MGLEGKTPAEACRIEIFGFVLMLCYWRDPNQADVNRWKKNQRFAKSEEEYQKRIEDDFPWYFDPVTNERYRDNWYVPSGFVAYWKRAKIFAFFSIIGGLGLQIIQLIVD